MKLTSKLIEQWKLEAEQVVNDSERAKNLVQQQASRVIILCERLAERATPIERALVIAFTEWIACNTDDLEQYQIMIDKHEEWKRSYIEGEA